MDMFEKLKILTDAAKYDVACTFCFSSLIALPMAGRCAGSTVRSCFIKAGTCPFLLRYFCQKAASVSLEATCARSASACRDSSSMISCIVFLSFCVLIQSLYWMSRFLNQPSVPMSTYRPTPPRAAGPCLKPFTSSTLTPST